VVNFTNILLKSIDYISIFFILGCSLVYASEFELMLEAGGVWQNRNDVQIPPDTGTRFEINGINKGPFFHYRIEGFYRINQKHALRIVYAPSSLEVTGRTNKPIIFNEKSFSDAEDLTVRYQFNSYRLSYIYGFWGFGDDQINLGFTGKIRDAAISFTQSGIHSKYDDVGFVPLLYFEYQKSLFPLWALNFNLDAAVAKQGRAIDAALKIKRQISKKTIMGFGFRTLEGGADNNKVFTFSWFNYAIVELSVVL
jgi:hypothetical protein